MSLRSGFGAGLQLVRTRTREGLAMIHLSWPEKSPSNTDNENV